MKCGWCKALILTYCFVTLGRFFNGESGAIRDVISTRALIILSFGSKDGGGIPTRGSKISLKISLSPSSAMIWRPDARHE